MGSPIPIILSVPTSGAGATPAATYAFFTSGYKPPRQSRAVGQDVVHNQNGVFRWRYDNGPGSFEWEPFQILLSDDFPGYKPGAAQQWIDLSFLWAYTEGPMGMAAPEGVYSVVWASNMALERQPIGKGAAGDKLEYRVPIALEEG